MRPLARLGGGVVGSAAVHGALVLLLVLTVDPSGSSDPADRVVEFAVYEPPPPPPPPVELPPPPAPPEAPPPPAPPPRPRPKPKAPPKQPPPPQAEAPPPPVDAPPPSNDAPPAEPSQKPVPIMSGISISSTVSAGEGTGMRLGVGNTLYGDPRRVAADPAAVEPYQGADTWVPMQKVSTRPEVAAKVKPAYPPEAREQGLEAQVVLLLRIDSEGRVVSVRVVEGAGHGFDESAMAAARKMRFSPATVDGQAVATDQRYTMTFLLD